MSLRCNASNVDKSIKHPLGLQNISVPKEYVYTVDRFFKICPNTVVRFKKSTTSTWTTSTSIHSRPARSVMHVNNGIQWPRIFMVSENGKVLLCSDCYYHTSEIQQEVYALRVDFIVFLIHRGQVDCALCLQALICPLTGIQLHSYELDHCASGSKSDSVGAMIMKGCPFTQICEESLKCRVLCVRCHSRVTYAQRSIGALRLKAEIRAQSMSMVDRIVQKLLFIDQCRML